MYINLCPNGQLRSTKRNMLAIGVFWAAGGAYALLRETLMRGELRVEWAVASAVLLLAGFASVAVAMDKVQLPDAYFSMTPERIRYRLSLLGREHLLFWEDIKVLQVTEHQVTFEQGDGGVAKLRLGLIQQPEVALHVSRSILLAALEKGIPVNGQAAETRKTTLQV
jgi:hypothetical protein